MAAWYPLSCTIAAQLGYILHLENINRYFIQLFYQYLFRFHNLTLGFFRWRLVNPFISEALILS
jgi:hypothetical protein